MQNLKIRVNSEAEAEEVKRLAVKAGYKLDALFGRKWSAEFCYLVLCENMAAGFGNEIMADGDKPLSIGELREMVNPMKEYLDKKPDGSYELIVSNGGCVDRDWIEIPEGAEVATICRNYIIFWKDEKYSFSVSEENKWCYKSCDDSRYFSLGEYMNEYGDVTIIWQREQDEPFLTPECTLNDQYAEIEQVRQVEIHGTVKAEPDFNFGAAQAIKVKSGSDSDHAADAMSFGLMGAGAASGGAKMRENNHYFINVSDVDEVDFYEIAKRYNVTDPAVQHILKKCLAIGNRGHKDLETDLKDILKTAKRALQINGFGD